VARVRGAGPVGSPAVAVGQAFNDAELPRRNVRVEAPRARSARGGTTRTRGRGATLARGGAYPLRSHDVPPRRRDVLPRLRGGVGGSCGRGMPARGNFRGTDRAGGGELTHWGAWRGGVSRPRYRGSFLTGKQRTTCWGTCWGRKLGTLFVIGAVDEVLAQSRPLLLDPLYGHPSELLHIDRPEFRETVKEFAQSVSNRWAPRIGGHQGARVGAPRRSTPARPRGPPPRTPARAKPFELRDSFVEPLLERVEFLPAGTGFRPDVAVEPAHPGDQKAQPPFCVLEVEVTDELELLFSRTPLVRRRIRER
jgi:hypothetical protein